MRGIVTSQKGNRWLEVNFQRGSQRNNYADLILLVYCVSSLLARVNWKPESTDSIDVFLALGLQESKRVALVEQKEQKEDRQHRQHRVLIKM